MDHTKQVMGILLTLVLSMGAGYATKKWIDTPAPVTGWCCMQQGTACAERTGFASCQADGGIAFDVSNSICNTVCGSAQ